MGHIIKQQEPVIEQLLCYYYSSLITCRLKIRLHFMCQGHHATPVCYLDYHLILEMGKLRGKLINLSYFFNIQLNLNEFLISKYLVCVYMDCVDVCVHV